MHTKKTDLQEFSRSILGRWQSLYSSIRSSNLGLRPGSEVSSLSWHAEAAWPIRPSLRAGRRKTKLTVLQCQVSVQIAVHLARDNKGGEKRHKWKTDTEITVVLDDNLGGNSVYATMGTSFSVTHSWYELSLQMPSLSLTYSVHREGISSNLGQLKPN